MALKLAASHFVNYGRENRTLLLIILSSMFVLVGLYFGYMWYMSYRERSAQYHFGTLLEQFDQAARDTNTEAFTALSDQFENASKQYRDTSLAPYFLLFQADALLQSEQKADALTAMSKAVKQFPTKNDLLPLCKTKRALVALDIGNKDDQQAGLRELQELAYDANNIYRDYALYHLGLYHWVHEDVAQAKHAWNDLVDSQRGSIETISPWASLVSEKLATLPA